MKHFFYPSTIAIFGVGSGSSNLAKNIIHNCLEMGYAGKILPVGKNPGVVFGKKIITDPEKENLQSDPITRNVGKNLLEKSMIKGRTNLSEYESKQFLASYQIPITQEMQVQNESSLIKAIENIGVAPLEKYDALDMINEIKGHKILCAVRGMEAVDINILTDILITIGKIGMENKNIKEIDINPPIISGNKPVAVDALVVLKASKER